MVNIISSLRPADRTQSPRFDPARPLDADFRKAMRQLAIGVSVVTIGTKPGRKALTAASVAELSDDPPRVMVAVDRAFASLAERCRCFGISILAGHHAHLAMRIDGSSGEDAFAGTCWHSMITGASLLCDALAVVDCELEEIIQRHACAIAIGRVMASRCGESGDALTYWRDDHHDISQGDDHVVESGWEPILRSRHVGCG